MAWELSSWLVLTRSFQVMGALAAGGLNGYLVALIYSKHLGLTNAMITLELMVCTVLSRPSMLLPIGVSTQTLGSRIECVYVRDR